MEIHRHVSWRKKEANRSVRGMSKCHLALLLDVSVWLTVDRVPVYLMPDLSSFISHRGLQCSSDRFLQTGLLANAIYETENELLGFMAHSQIYPQAAKCHLDSSGNEMNACKLHVHSPCDVNWALGLSEMSRQGDEKKGIVWTCSCKFYTWQKKT